MGAFVVKAGAKCVVIKDGADWGDFKNFMAHKVKEKQIFDKSELVIDPTGIAKYAARSCDKTIKGMYAKDGWYGFQRKGWTLLVPSFQVLYNRSE